MHQKLSKSFFVILAVLACIFLSGCTNTEYLNHAKPDIISKESGGTLSIHFIDVGQGDSILILSHNSQTILVDAGPTSSGDSLVEYIKSQGVKKIDYIVSTHPHEDHIGGMLKVLENFEIGMILDPAYAYTTKTFERYLEKIDELDIPFIAARSGDSYHLGDIKVNILWPEEVPETVKDVNEISVVILLTYNDFSLLLTGDIGTATESSIVNNYDLGKVTVLKVGHHGSKGSSSNKFIEAIKPDVSVISLGADNSYGHPTQEALDRLAESEIYRTDLNGSIIVETDGVYFSIRTTK